MPSRRNVLAAAFGGLAAAELAEARGPAGPTIGRSAKRRSLPKDPIRITKLETFLVKPRWLFLKVHTNAGIVGLGEPIVEGRALTVADGGQGDRAVPASARTRARSSITGRRSTGTPSTAAARSSPAP